MDKYRQELGGKPIIVNSWYRPSNVNSKVSDTLERTAVSSAIAPHEKYRIQQLTQKSTAVLEQVESDIEQETEKLILLEEEQ